MSRASPVAVVSLLSALLGIACERGHNLPYVEPHDEGLEVDPASYDAFDIGAMEGIGGPGLRTDAAPLYAGGIGFCDPIGEVGSDGVRVDDGVELFLPASELNAVPERCPSETPRALTEYPSAVVVTPAHTYSGYLSGGLHSLDAERQGRLLDPAVGGVRDLAFHEGSLFVAGGFTLIGGRPRPYLAEIDPESGQATEWFAEIDAPVDALAISGEGILYLAGSFTSVAGASRAGLAAIALDSRELLPWAPTADGAVDLLFAHADIIYVAGDFLSVDGEQRVRGAAFRAGSGELLPWNPETNGPILSMARLGDWLYLGGDFSSAGGEERIRLAQLDPITGAAGPWRPMSGVPVRALVAAGDTLVAGGRFLIDGLAMHALVAFR